MPANCLAPIIKCAYKKVQQQIKEEAFQDGDFLQKVHQYLSSPDVLENIILEQVYCERNTRVMRVHVLILLLMLWNTEPSGTSPNIPDHDAVCLNKQRNKNTKQTNKNRDNRFKEKMKQIPTHTRG